jgi:hypothetical protein
MLRRHQGGVADALVAEAAHEVCSRLNALELPCREIRERKHLDPITKAVLLEYTRRQPTSITLRSPTFPGAGPVDVVLARPRLLMELKWSYNPRDKIFESVWDAVKLSLLGPAGGYRDLYIACGAANTAWEQTETRDLFRSGSVRPRDLWARELAPPGPNGGRTVGDDLVAGARGNRPLAMHESLTLTLIAEAGFRDCALRIVRVSPDGHPKSVS